MTPTEYRVHLDRQLALFNEGGAFLKVTTHSGTELSAVLDFIQVVRVHPHYATDGSIMDVDFWLAWFPVAWTDPDSRFNSPHLIKVVRMEIDDEWDASLTDSEGRAYSIQLLFDGLDGEKIDQRKKWLLSKTPRTLEKQEDTLSYFVEWADEWDIEPTDEGDE